MIAPVLTQEWFESLQSKGLTSLTAISKLNSKNCKQTFSKTIPKALRDEGFNTTLVIKNHKGRWKYVGFNCTEVAGALKVTSSPEVMWTGYVYHTPTQTWYACKGVDIFRGTIPYSSKIIPPQIESEV